MALGCSSTDCVLVGDHFPSKGCSDAALGRSQALLLAHPALIACSSHQEQGFSCVVLIFTWSFLLPLQLYICAMIWMH